MMAFVQAERCRRKVINEYLDGRGVSCDEVEGARCDMCGKDLTE